MRFFHIGAVICLLSLFAAQSCSCNKKNEEAQVSEKSVQPSPSVNPQASQSAVTGEPAKLGVEVLSPGDGAEAQEKMKVTVHYTGKLVDGTKFDSSLDRNEPFSFVLGAGNVIAGWDQGVKGMKVKEKRRLTIPPHLGYGERGVPGVIPPQSTLIFEVELIKVEP